MPANSYNVVRYSTFPYRQTHPDRLAAIGKLFGMQPAPVDACRMLEIGCGSGGNLIPMAYTLPDSRFAGVDLAADPVAEGVRMIEELGLNNVTLHAGDLREISPEWGEFDYIVAHGLYSWAPAEVRQGLLEVCRARLAPEGIAFVSYNALPGGRVRQMLREMMLHHVRRTEDPVARISQAREFLQTLLRTHLGPAEWEAQRDSEIKGLLAKDDGSLYHDDLAEINQRFYFHEFIAAAHLHRLQYVGEAEPHQMFDPTGALAAFEGDFLEREQQLDFLKTRRFRQNLLCRSERPLTREISPQQMRGFLFSAPARQLENGSVEGSRGARVSGNEAALRVAMAIGEVYPLPASFEELVPYASDEDTLGEILCAFLIGGFADLHVYGFPCEERVTERPRASRLVRSQAARSEMVTNACHISVQLDELGRRIVELADGTRTQAEIADGLGVEGAHEMLPARLEWMASRALLEG
jgi:SAM-dependent methyltransferase